MRSKFYTGKGLLFYYLRNRHENGRQVSLDDLHGRRQTTGQTLERRGWVNKKDTLTPPFKIQDTHGSGIDVEIFSALTKADEEALINSIRDETLRSGANSVHINSNGYPLSTRTLHTLSQLEWCTVVFVGVHNPPPSVAVADNMASAHKHTTQVPAPVFGDGFSTALWAYEYPHRAPGIETLSPIDRKRRIKSENAESVIADIKNIIDFLNKKNEPHFINLTISNIEDFDRKELLNELKKLAIALNNNKGYLSITCTNPDIAEMLLQEGFQVYIQPDESGKFLTGIKDQLIIPNRPNNPFDPTKSIGEPVCVQPQRFIIPVNAKNLQTGNNQLMDDAIQVASRVRGRILYDINCSDLLDLGLTFLGGAYRITEFNPRTSFTSTDPFIVEVLRHDGIRAHDPKIARARLVDNRTFKPHPFFSPPEICGVVNGEPVYVTRLNIAELEKRNIPAIADLVDSLDFELLDRKCIVLIGTEGKIDPDRVQTVHGRGENLVLVMSPEAKIATGLHNTIPHFRDIDSVLTAIELEIDTDEGLLYSSISYDKENDCLIITFPRGKEGKSIISEGILSGNRMESEIRRLSRSCRRTCFTIPSSIKDPIHDKFRQSLQDGLPFGASLNLVSNQKDFPTPPGVNRFKTVQEFIQTSKLPTCEFLHRRIVTHDGQEILVVSLRTYERAEGILDKRQKEIKALPDMPIVFRMGFTGFREGNPVIPTTLHAALDGLVERQAESPIIIVTSDRDHLSPCERRGFLTVPTVEKAVQILSENTSSIPPPGDSLRGNRWKALTPPVYIDGVWCTNVTNDQNQVIDQLQLQSELNYLVSEAKKHDSLYKVLVHIPQPDITHGVAGVLEEVYYNNRWCIGFYVPEDTLRKGLGRVRNSKPSYVPSQYLFKTREEGIAALKTNNKLDLIEETPEQTPPHQKLKPAPRVHVLEITNPETPGQFGNDDNPIRIFDNELPPDVRLDEHYIRSESEKAIKEASRVFYEYIFMNKTTSVTFNLNGHNIRSDLLKALLEVAKQGNCRIAFYNPNTYFNNFAAGIHLPVYPDIAHARAALVAPDIVLGNFNPPQNIVHVETFPPVDQVNYPILTYTAEAQNDTSFISLTTSQLKFDEYPYPYLVIDLSNLRSCDDEIINDLIRIHNLAGRRNIIVGIIIPGDIKCTGTLDIVRALGEKNVVFYKDADKKKNPTTEIEHLLAHAGKLPEITLPSGRGFRFFERPIPILQSPNIFFLYLQNPTAFQDFLFVQDANLFQGQKLIIDFRHISHSDFPTILKELDRCLLNRTYPRDNNQVVLLTNWRNDRALVSRPNLHTVSSIAQAREILSTHPLSSPNFSWPTFTKPSVNNEGVLVVSQQLLGKTPISLLPDLNRSIVYEQLFAIRRIPGSEARTVFYVIPDSVRLDTIRDYTYLQTLCDLFGDRLVFCSGSVGNRKVLFGLMFNSDDFPKFPDLGVYSSREEFDICRRLGITPPKGGFTNLTLLPDSVPGIAVFTPNPQIPIEKEIDLTQRDLRLICDQINIIYVVPPDAEIPLNLNVQQLNELRRRCDSGKTPRRNIVFVYDGPYSKLLSTQIGRFGFTVRRSTEEAMCDLDPNPILS